MLWKANFVVHVATNIGGFGLGTTIHQAFIDATENHSQKYFESIVDEHRD